MAQTFYSGVVLLCWRRTNVDFVAFVLVLVLRLVTCTRWSKCVTPKAKGEGVETEMRSNERSRGAAVRLEGEVWIDNGPQLRAGTTVLSTVRSRQPHRSAAVRNDRLAHTQDSLFHKKPVPAVKASPG